MKPDALARLLDASSVALKRDFWRGYGPKGDWGTHGKFGHVYLDGSGFLLVFVSERLSTHRWNAVKRDLHFCRLMQDGDSEGCLHIDRMPTKTEGALIREALGIRKRRALDRVNLQIIGRPFVKSVGGRFIAGERIWQRDDETIAAFEARVEAMVSAVA